MHALPRIADMSQSDGLFTESLMAAIAERRRRGQGPHARLPRRQGGESREVMSAAAGPKYRDVSLGGSLSAHFATAADGSTLVTSTEALQPYPLRLTDRLLHWAAVAPDHTLAAKRHQGGDWRRISYAQALHSARCIAQALINMKLSADRPVAILSDNDLEQLLLGFGAMLAGVPFAPISAAYSLDVAGLRQVEAHPRRADDPSKSRIYKDVSKGMPETASRHYLPLFFAKTATLFDYLLKHATLCLHHDVDTAIATFTKDAASRYKLLRGDPQRPLLETKDLFLEAEQFYLRAKEFARLDIVNHDTGATLTPCPTTAIPSIAVDRRADVPTQAFKTFLHNYAGRVLLVADTLGRREIISGYFKEYGLTPTVCEDFASFLVGKKKSPSP